MPHKSVGNTIPMEYELKFLLDAAPAEALAAAPVFIEQGWIPGVRLRERLRRCVYPDNTVRYIRTVKLGKSVARIEIEEETDKATFDAMWPLTHRARIRKYRYAVQHAGHTWEIDVFQERDLVLAEVELSHESERVVIPDWLRPHVIREVTGESQYTNSRMARPDSNSPGLPRDGHSQPDISGTRPTGIRPTDIRPTGA